MTPIRQLLRGLGPAIGPGSAREAARAGTGALAGLLVAGASVLSPGVDLETGLYLIAPFGATSVLVFAVPNSPLAQPWSAVIGNTVAALVGVAVSLAVADPALRVALAVGLAIFAMTLVRAMHPPAGAVAMTAALSPDAVETLGFGFALAPVAAGTVFLVGAAMIHARLTGRHYPFRQYDDTAPRGASDHGPAARLGLDEEALTALLERYRQSLNLGVEDFARLVGAAELQVAARRATPATAGDIMSPDPVTVGPETPLSEVAELFRQHGFTALPVVEAGRYLGVIFQIHLIRRAEEDAFRLDRGFARAMARLIEPGRKAPTRAREIMAVATPRATRDTPIAALLPQMADGTSDAVVVLHRGRLAGIVTRTDLVSALALAGLSPATDAQ